MMQKKCILEVLHRDRKLRNTGPEVTVLLSSVYLRVFQHLWMTLEGLPLAGQFCSSMLRDDAHMGRTFSWTCRFHWGAARPFLPHLTFPSSRHQILVNLDGMLRSRLVLWTSSSSSQPLPPLPPQISHPLFHPRGFGCVLPLFLLHFRSHMSSAPSHLPSMNKATASYGDRGFLLSLFHEQCVIFSQCSVRNPGRT